MCNNGSSGWSLRRSFYAPALRGAVLRRYSEPHRFADAFQDEPTVLRETVPDANWKARRLFLHRQAKSAKIAGSRPEFARSWEKSHPSLTQMAAGARACRRLCSRHPLGASLAT